MVMEISALRLATTAQGVKQVMGASSPEMTASAPDGVDATLIVSVVPRDTDAQPPSMAQAAKTPKARIYVLPSPGSTEPQPGRAGKGVPSNRSLGVAEISVVVPVWLAQPSSRSC